MNYMVTFTYFFSGGDPRHDNRNALLNSQILEREKESINNLNHE